MYDEKSDDNKTMFFGIGQKFVFSAPKDFCGLGVDCSWTPIDSDGEEGPVSNDELKDGQEYVVKSAQEGDNEILYPERIDVEEDDDED